LWGQVIPAQAGVGKAQVAVGRGETGVELNGLVELGDGIIKTA
jgi:hypothetical protein